MSEPNAYGEVSTGVTLAADNIADIVLYDSNSSRDTMGVGQQDRRKEEKAHEGRPTELNRTHNP